MSAYTDLRSKQKARFKSPRHLAMDGEAEAGATEGAQIVQKPPSALKVPRKRSEWLVPILLALVFTAAGTAAYVLCLYGSRL